MINAYYTIEGGLITKIVIYISIEEYPPKSVVQRGVGLLQDFLMANEVKQIDARVRVQHCWKWNPPELGWLKMNVDAGFKDGQASYGFVVRNHIGVFQMAGVGKMEFLSTIVHAEMKSFDILK